jgi:hypothetical protein
VSKPSRPVDASAAAMASQRLAAQQIARPAFSDPAELVGWLGAVQAQDYAAAQWAVGLRLGGRAGDEGAITRALARGAIVRTHVMRWTWQLVTPADLGWMLPLVAARLVARAATRYRELDLDAATFRRSAAAIERALRDGAHLTRRELGAALRAAGVAVDGPRLSHVLARAELDGVICSGTPRAKQTTHALVAHRAPSTGAPLPRDEALARLAQRYFGSRGPASAADFAWWSGLQPAEARAGLEAIKSALACQVVGGVAYWAAADTPRPTAAALARAYLLPAFDEYLVGYRDRGAVLSAADTRRHNAGGGMLAPCIVVGGRVVGTWRRTLQPGVVSIALTLFSRPARRDRDSIVDAAQRYAAFLGRKTKILFGAT